MIYQNIYPGTFHERLNRFVARVTVEGVSQLVHVKNTGRCKELLIPGTQVYLEKSDNPNRKTKYSLIAVHKGDLLINMDSQVPNQVIYEAILAGQLEAFQDLTLLKKEQTYGKSRFDLYYESQTQKGYIEIKGVTLESQGIAAFPDAPTSRGAKHVSELAEAMNQGYKNYIIFLIQMEPVHLFVPNQTKDPAFVSALKAAHQAGVKILCLNSHITPTSIDVKGPIDFDLDQIFSQ